MLESLLGMLSFTEGVQFLRYVSVGGFNAAYYFGLYTVLIWCGVNYKVAACAAFSTGFVIAFALHKFWTFQNMGLETVDLQMALFALKKVSFFTANYYALKFLVTRWGRPILTQLGLGVPGGILSYLATKYIFTF